MWKLPILGAALLLGACAQFQTSGAERAQLERASDQQASAYLDCVKRESLLFTDSNRDAAFVYDAVSQRCAADLAEFRVAESAYLGSKMMMIEAPLQAELDELTRRARAVIAEQMVSTPAARAATSDAAAAAPAARPAPSVRSGGLTSDERVYIDCMLEQARLYSALQESAETIAEVAANKCRTYLQGPNVTALAQEGRARVLGAVFDARVVPKR